MILFALDAVKLTFIQDKINGYNAQIKGKCKKILKTEVKAKVIAERKKKKSKKKTILKSIAMATVSTTIE